MRDVEPAFGPLYPTIPSAAKFRKMRNPDMNAYGEAVLGGIRKIQARELMGELVPLKNPNCASGTAHTDGDAILKSIRAKHATALASPFVPVNIAKWQRAKLAEYNRMMGR